MQASKASLEEGSTLSANWNTPTRFELRDGGSFLLDRVGSTKIFTPEDLTREQRAMRDTARRFADAEVGSLRHAGHDWMACIDADLEDGPRGEELVPA